MGKKKTKNTKNQTSIDVVLEITIDHAFKNKSNIWHIKVKMNDKKPEETICPIDIFGYMMDNYISIMDLFRALHHSTTPLRKHMKILAKNQKIKPSDDNTFKQNSSTRYDKQEHKRQTKQRQNNVSMLSNSMESIKKNTSSNGILEQSALALVLAQIPLKQIKKDIQKNSKFNITIPITKYPDLSSIQQQQQVSVMSMSESVMNLSASVMSRIPLLG